MTLVEMSEFFKWMTVINFALLFLSFSLSVALKGLVLKIHSKLFALDESRIAELLYGLFGIYKIIIIVFCLVPYITLLVIQ